MTNDQIAMTNEERGNDGSVVVIGARSLVICLSVAL
jgi:hypothetical protein